MSRTGKISTLLFLSIFSSLAIAEAGSERTLQRLDDASAEKHTLEMLVKQGKVLSIAPAGTTGTTGMIQTYRTNGKVRPYEMRVKTPDGEIHTVGFMSAPVGANNN
ncbi:co-regulatory protein PtrA N-terminal domain-containing protein [Stutzerimonas zhaodongensis]|jgi:hypothetical protein|uniref:co-regulatory protein PtrA N-terminal domain-containing protein n=1 Tax=Stutzerimonas zhaodongensis TaxID=1176257 RepID=UPI001F4E1DC9|nr:co-regulatory protein PtrA N-terminal domain-containing protein [Stutzerimonas zhaodongensis]UNG19502.1 hypothetical protein MKP10_04440 [Stutzerimonas zhaodongensis]